MYLPPTATLQQTYIEKLSKFALESNLKTAANSLPSPLNEVIMDPSSSSCLMF